MLSHLLFSPDSKRSPMECSPKSLCIYIVVNNAGYTRKWLPRRTWEPFGTGSSDIVLKTSVWFFQFKRLVGALLEYEGKNRHRNPENQPQY